MALISAKTIITSVSLFHLTIAFFFLTSPQTIDDQALVWVIGESLGLPLARGLDVQNPALALAAVLLAYMGLSDLTSLSMPEEIGLIYHWGTQAPLRALISMILAFYSFFFGPSSPAYASSPRGILTHPPTAHNPSYNPSSWGGDQLKNRVFFSFMFVEMVSWFWAWVTLREERDALVVRLRKSMDRRD